MIDDVLTAEVETAVRKAVAGEVMPRWRALAEHEVHTKDGPHDLVTAADREAEARLERDLTDLLPGSLFVGEEGVHADPSRLEALRGEAPVWIVDPVDGTRPFVRGEEGFCTLVALARYGEVVASWTYAPVPDRMAVARRRGGALLDGEALTAGAPAPGADLRVVHSHPDFCDEDQKRALTGLRTEGVRARSCSSAGLAYLDIARGELDAVAFSWENSWDHAAGLLLVAEAGGTHTTLSGVPFRLTGGNALPFTAARDAATVRRIVDLLQDG